MSHASFEIKFPENRYKYGFFEFYPAKNRRILGFFTIQNTKNHRFWMQVALLEACEL
jgi:hypothetical protein